MVGEGVRLRSDEGYYYYYDYDCYYCYDDVGMQIARWADAVDEGVAGAGGDGSAVDG
jgi:hypothetical protein